MAFAQTAAFTVAETLAARIRSRQAHVGIVGLGYVGLPLAVEFARAGFPVTGIDLNVQKVARVNCGDSYVGDIPSATLAPLIEAGSFRASSDFDELLDLDTVNICVPTPLRKTKDPDMSYIVSSCQEIAKRLHPGMLVILESTTYPGTTEELVLPMLSRSGLEVGRGHWGTELGQGHASLGLLCPAAPPELYLTSSRDGRPRVRMRISDGRIRADAGVTDLRLFGDDHATPDLARIRAVAQGIADSQDVILGVGLTRKFRSSDDSPYRHWLQVNNIHLKEAPTWLLG